MVLLEGVWIFCHHDQAITQDCLFKRGVYSSIDDVIIASLVSPSLLTAAPGLQVHLLQLTRGEVHNLLGQVIAILHHVGLALGGGGGGGRIKMVREGESGIRKE